MCLFCIYIYVCGGVRMWGWAAGGCADRPMGERMKEQINGWTLRLGKNEGG